MFITFEGIDFCGKSTQIELLKKHFISENKKVEIIREPGGTAISEKIRELLLSKIHKEMFMEPEIFLFSASRAQLVREKIQPLLDEGYYVLSDRFHDSTTAYQGYGRGVDLDTVNKINHLAIDGTLPDLTFIIDIPVEVAESRKMEKPEMSDDVTKDEGASINRMVEFINKEISSKDDAERRGAGSFCQTGLSRRCHLG